MATLVEMNPADHISAGCVGEVGNRTFFIQARKGSDFLTLLCEKFQLQQLASGIREFTDELQRNDPDLPPLVIGREWLGDIKAGMPELPKQVWERLVTEYGLKPDDADQFIHDRKLLKFFLEFSAVLC